MQHNSWVQLWADGTLGDGTLQLCAMLACHAREPPAGTQGAYLILASSLIAFMYVITANISLFAPLGMGSGLWGLVLSTGMT